MSRRMVKLIHADGFFPNNDAQNLKNLSETLQFVPTHQGLEVPNFNLIFPNIEILLYKVLGERVTVDVKKSGILRKPFHNLIHFEDFKTTEEWCFMVALEPTTVNFWHHIDPNDKLGDWGKVNAKNALEGIDFNFKNLFEWKIHTNILLETNQCLFYRPWTFHSLEEGLIQYYKLLSDNRCRILIMGMPNSKRASISHKLYKKLSKDSMLIRSIDVRRQSKDLDFTIDGQMRHCYRMLNFVRSMTKKISIIDMVCPLKTMREILNPDIIIFVNDKTVSKYTELNEIFEIPEFYDLDCDDDDDKTIENIVKFIKHKTKVKLID